MQIGINICFLLFFFIFHAYSLEKQHVFNYKNTYKYSVRNDAIQNFETGNITVADSLFNIADSLDMLNANDISKWVQIKFLLKEYKDIANICCKALTKEPDIEYYINNNLYENLKDQPVEIKKLILSSYEICIFNRKKCDTIKTFLWLYNTYGSFAMFDEQTNIIKTYEKKIPHVAEYYLSMAKTRFLNGFIEKAIIPAIEAFTKTDSLSEQKSLAAMIVYECYKILGKNNDALFWLSKASFNDIKSKINAITFFQEAQYLNKADSIINTLSPGISKDTLLIRQALFSQNVSLALNILNTIKDYNSGLIWKLRIFTFSGRIKDILEWVDTVSFSSFWSYASEFLSYRYKFNIIKEDPSSFKDFGTIQYEIWLNRPEKAISLIKKDFSSSIKMLIACDVCRALYKKQLYSDALKIIYMFELSDLSPELSFILGDILIKQGETNKGIKILEDIIINYPSDVFSYKAKKILEEIKK
jgi:hypothetical protein